VLTLAVLLGVAEDAAHRQTWRNPTSEHRAYFTALREWGYPLSTVEQLVLTDADEADRTTAPDADRDAARVEESSPAANEIGVAEPEPVDDGSGDAVA
jgi:ParB family chromosome partitioning protein